MNKLLVTLYIPEIGMEFDTYLPINKKIGTIKKYLINAICDLSKNNFDKSYDNISFIDHETGKEYKNNFYLKDTEIQNGSKIIIL